MASGTPPALYLSQFHSKTTSPSEIETSKSDVGYFTYRTRPQVRAASPAEQPSCGATPLRSPRRLLNTPPISEPLPCRHEKRCVSPGSYASSSNRHTRANTSSDKPSAESYPCDPNSYAESLLSSDTCRSPYSNGSSEYLETPPFQGDNDSPPYKPERSSDESLTMMSKKNRASTMPDGRKRRHRRHKHQSRRAKRTGAHAHNPHWWRPGCQIMPTAPTVQSGLFQGYPNARFAADSQHRQACAPERSHPGLRGLLNHRKIRRRWSCVEIGAFQVHPHSMLSKTNHKKVSGTAVVGQDLFAPNSQGRRYRSSSFTQGAIDYDMIQTVREMLTHREVPSTNVEIPTSITLRRPTHQRPGPEIHEQSQRSDHDTTASRPNLALGLLEKLQQRPASATYLITTEDLEVITELIATKLRRHYESRRELYPYPQSSARNVADEEHEPEPVGQDGNQQGGSSPLISADVTEVPEDQLIGPSDNQLNISNDITKIQFGPQLKPQKSFHEVIWDGEQMPCMLSVDDCDDRRASSLDDQAEDLCLSMKEYSSAQASRKDKGVAFDPSNARTSITHWTNGCPQNDITLIVTSSDSDEIEGAVTVLAGTGFTEPSSSSIVLNADKMKTRAMFVAVSSALTDPTRPPIVSSSSYPSEGISTGQPGGSFGIKTERTNPKHKSSLRHAVSGKAVEDVVSFPPLNPRRTTKDWYSPLPEIEVVPHLSTSRSLYDIGLDASFGPNSSNTVTSKASEIFDAFHSTQSTSPCKVEFKSSQEMFWKVSDPKSQQKSVIKTHPSAQSRNGESLSVGSAIGTCTGERRNSRTYMQRVRTIDNAHKGERDHPSNSNRWRPPSICPLPQFSVLEEDLDETEHWIPGPEPGIRRLSRMRSGMTDRATVLELKCPPVPKVDCTGIYGSITGAGGGISGLYRKKCVRQGEGGCDRHVCEGCASDLRTLSVDWIG